MMMMIIAEFPLKTFCQILIYFNIFKMFNHDNDNDDVDNDDDDDDDDDDDGDHNDSGLDVSTEYEFTVRGINNLGEGDFSTPPVRAIITGNSP